MKLILKLAFCIILLIVEGVSSSVSGLQPGSEAGPLAESAEAGSGGGGSAVEYADMSSGDEPEGANLELDGQQREEAGQMNAGASQGSGGKEGESAESYSGEGFTYFEESSKELMPYEYEGYSKTPISVLVKDKNTKYDKESYEKLNSPETRGEERTLRYEYHKKMPKFDQDQRSMALDVMNYVPRSLVHFDSLDKIPARDRNTFLDIRERPAATVSPSGHYLMMTAKAEEECPENKYDIFIRKSKNKTLNKLKKQRKRKLLHKFKKLDLENKKHGLKVDADDQSKLDRYQLLTMSEFYSKRQWKRYDHKVKDLVLYIDSMNKILELSYMNYVTYSKYASTSKYYEKLPRRIKKETNAIQQKFNTIPFTALGSYLPTEQDFQILVKSVGKNIKKVRRRLKFTRGKRVLFIGYQKSPVASINLPLDDASIEEMIKDQVSQKKQYKYKSFKKIFKQMKKSQYKRDAKFNLIHVQSIQAYLGVLKNLWVCLVSGLFKILKYKQRVSACIVGNVPNYSVANVLNRVAIAMLKSSPFTNVSKFILFPVTIGNEKYGCDQRNSDQLFGHMIERWDQPIFTLNGYRILKSIWYGSRLYKYNLSIIHNYARSFDAIRYRFQRAFRSTSPVIILQQAFPFGFLTRVSDCNRLVRDLRKIRLIRITLVCLKKNGGTEAVDQNDLLLKESELLGFTTTKKQRKDGQKRLVTINNVNSPRDMDVVNEWLNGLRTKILNNNVQMMIIPMMVIEKGSFKKNYKKLKKVLKLQRKKKS
ncbi:putative signal peptide-containing protein [Cryptosporidium canis]|uniref:Signal peptide-containing protein n=1 Tax=Cryptosporidium canis TaxID=195482 RepID=A0A9D5HW00_9CRYT|nr:putative signal peptide-containing protein [Cryptosporidium canis]